MGGLPQTRHCYASHPLEPCLGPSLPLSLCFPPVAQGCLGVLGLQEPMFPMPKTQEVAEVGSHICTSRAPDPTLQHFGLCIPASVSRDPDLCPDPDTLGLGSLPGLAQ